MSSISLSRPSDVSRLPAKIARDRTAIRLWLYAIAALILALVVVGGATRLTESGLSITEWKPIHGIVPPLSEAEWTEEFQLYQRIPQYQELNQGMSLSGFKTIFWWEWAHRFLARSVGFAFALPLAFFWATGRVEGWLKPRLVALLALGGLQGAIGWWMVASGLSERTDVSHLRLAVHLVTALVILAGLVWTGLDLMQLHRDRLATPARLAPAAILALALLFVQIVWGAFTAGLDAGYAFASWPLMGDSLFPAGVPLTGTLADAVDNPVMVQFIHRWLAFVVAVALFWLSVRATRRGSRAGFAVTGLVTLQIFLGVATLLTGVQIAVAVAHQANAALLLIATVAAAHRIGIPKASI